MPSTEVPVKRKNSLVLVPIHDLIFWPLSCKLRAYEEDSFFGGGYMVYFVARFSVVEMGFQKIKNQKKTPVNYGYPCVLKKLDFFSWVSSISCFHLFSNRH